MYLKPTGSPISSPWSLAAALLLLPGLAWSQTDWNAETLPEAELDNRHIRAIWGADADHIFAVGDEGLILHGNVAGEWEVIGVSTTDNFLSIDGTSASQVYAATETTIFEYDGQEWRDADLPVNGSLIFGATETYGVVAALPDGGVLTGAIANGGNTWHYPNGGPWLLGCGGGNVSPTHFETHGTSLFRATGNAAIGIFTPGPNDTNCANLGEIAGYWDSLVYGVYGDTAAGNPLNPAIWDFAVTGQRVHVVGNLGTWYNDGDDRENWIDLGDGDDFLGQALEVFSDSDILVVGADGILPAIRRYDGSSWSSMSAPTNPTAFGLNDVWALDTDTLFAVGQFGTVLRLGEVPVVPTSLGVTVSIRRQVIDIGIENTGEIAAQIEIVGGTFGQLHAEPSDGAGDPACLFRHPAFQSEGFDCDYALGGFDLAPGASAEVQVDLDSAEGATYEATGTVEVVVGATFTNGSVVTESVTATFPIADLAVTLEEVEGLLNTVKLENRGPGVTILPSDLGGATLQSGESTVVEVADLFPLTIVGSAFDPDLSNNTVSAQDFRDEGGETETGCAKSGCNTQRGTAGLLMLLAALGLTRRRLR